MPVANYRKQIGIVVFLIVCVAFVRSFFLEPKQEDDWLHLQPVMLESIEHKYGLTAKQRFVVWQKLIATGKSLPEQSKLQEVNDFFNHTILFTNDSVVWQKEDYWATPIELLAKGMGDCEDFTIAKYFTLLALGVDDNKLRITYVKALRLNLPHMVLTYFASPQADPLVLDNLSFKISSATERSDLLPVYSFNGTHLWLNKLKGSGAVISDGSQLNIWNDLNRRMLKNIF